MIKLLFCILFILFSSLCAFSQGIKDLDYTQIDSFALSIKKRYTDIDNLAWALTHQYKEEHEKVRVIFRWISNNISYDCKLYDKIQDYRRFTKKQKQKFWRKNTDEKVIRNTLRKRKAVCQGYALLFKAICQKAGLQVEYISGYDKNKIAKKNSFGHAWNVVKINGKWYLLDPTWASGYVKEKEKEMSEKEGKPNKHIKQKKKVKKKKQEKIFVQRFNESYFLTPSYLMIYDHFPDRSRWQLLDPPIDKNAFKKFPIVGDAFFTHKTIICESDTYVIKSTIESYVNFRFKLSGEIKGIDVVINRAKYAQPIDFQKESREYFFSKKFSKKGSYVLTFYVNGEHFLTQKVVVK